MPVATNLMMKNLEYLSTFFFFTPQVWIDLLASFQCSELLAILARLPSVFPLAWDGLFFNQCPDWYQE